MRLVRPVGEASSLSIPAIAGSISSTIGCICSCVSFLRIILSANGPPSMEPAIKPKVAAAMAMVPAPCSPMFSSTPANPPAVPCPPVMDILPEAMPIRGSTPMRRVIPMGIKFCMVIMMTNRTSMMIRSLPPRFKTFRSLWKPTLVKNATIKTSFNVPSNDTSTLNQPYNTRVINEKMMPPLTGDGTQNFCKKLILLVKNIPTMRAKAPMPAVCMMSSSTFIIFMFVFVLESILYLYIRGMSVHFCITTTCVKHVVPVNSQVPSSSQLLVH